VSEPGAVATGSNSHLKNQSCRIDPVASAPGSDTAQLIVSDSSS